MTPDEERFCKAYYSWKMRWAPDVEPLPEKFNITPARAAQLARVVHHTFEMERLAAVKKYDNRGPNLPDKRAGA